MAASLKTDIFPRPALKLINFGISPKLAIFQSLSRVEALLLELFRVQKNSITSKIMLSFTRQLLRTEFNFNCQQTDD